MRKCLTSISVALLLTGCGSSPKTHFYTLNTEPASIGRQAIGFPLQLTAVHLPPSLDRRQMVRMSGPNSVQISETDRWSASFGEMVRNVLAQDLSARLPNRKVILPRAPAPAGTAELVVTLAQFGPAANGRVGLRGSYALLGANSQTPVLERNFHIDAGPAPSAEATAAAMSQALGQLAGKIAAGVSRASPPNNSPRLDSFVR